MTPMRDGSEKADVCLLLEGTCPYVAGGVSGWVYDLLRSHPALSFHLVSLVPDERPRADKRESPRGALRVVLASDAMPDDTTRAPRCPMTRRGRRDAR